MKLGIFGSLDRPGIYGAEKEAVLSRSKAALNLTRLPEAMPWYSSDRIATLLGNGLLTCTRADNGLQELYGEQAMLYYRDTADLIEQLSSKLKTEAWRETARQGWEISHKNFKACAMTTAMLQVIYGMRVTCITQPTI